MDGIPNATNFQAMRNISRENSKGRKLSFASKTD